MNRLPSILTITAVWLSTALASLAAPQSRPNIIFFLSDDHRWDRMGCAGHPILKTPTMDKLAADGVRFTNMFVTTSICAASRATLFTGLHERTHGYTFGTPPISEEHRQASYPELLRNNGYWTGFVGKFGVSVAGGTEGVAKMFDEFHPLNRAPYHKKMPDGSTRHVTEIAGDRAVDFLRDRPADLPFCLSVSFNAAHAEDRDKRPGEGHFPWPKAVDGLYEDVEIPNARLSDPSVYLAHPNFMKRSMNRDRFFWRWDNREKFETNLRAYYRMITGLDRVMGRVLEEVEKLGQADNTVVIFSGDNGYYEGQRGFAGKWSHYEESLRVPLIIHDPRAPAEQRGVVSHPMVLNLDVSPTILAFAGLEAPAHVQGRSLVPLLEGENPADWREATFCEHLMDNRSIPKWEGVRGPRFVYARYFEQTPVFEYLHDLEVDPDQLVNLAGDPEYEPVLRQMRQQTDTLRDEYGGPFDVGRIRAWKAEQAAKRQAARKKS